MHIGKYGAGAESESQARCTLTPFNEQISNSKGCNSTVVSDVSMFSV